MKNKINNDTPAKTITGESQNRKVNNVIATNPVITYLIISFIFNPKGYGNIFQKVS